MEILKLLCGWALEGRSGNGRRMGEALSRPRPSCHTPVTRTAHGNYFRGSTLTFARLGLVATSPSSSTKNRAPRGLRPFNQLLSKTVS
jgi:hypothetical protein